MFPIAVAAFGWQVHGLWVGIVVAILFVLAISGAKIVELV